MAKFYSVISPSGWPESILFTSSGDKKLSTMLRLQSIPLLFVFIATCFLNNAVFAQDLDVLKGGVVKITAINPNRVGTGVIVGVKGKTVYIATASHVIENDPSPQVTFYQDRSHSYPAKIQGMEGGNPKGLAALVVESDLPSGIRPLAFHVEAKLTGGEKVSVIGFPRLVPVPWAVVEGTITGLVGPDLIFAGPVEEGNSGGPLLYQGKVVGLITEIAGSYKYAKPALLAQFELKNWQLLFTDAEPSSSPPSGQAPSPLQTEVFHPKGMVLVPDGEFLRGSPEDESRSADERPLGIKAGVGAILALLLIASSFMRVTPVISVHVETTRMEFSVAPGVDDKRLTDTVTFETLTVENIGKLAISPDRLLVADPADYDMASDSYPPKAWVDIPVNGRTVQFHADLSGISSEITIEPTDHQKSDTGQLDSIVLTDETFVTMEVSSNNAVTWAIRKKESPQRVVVSRVHAVQLNQTGLKAQGDLPIPFSQDQELNYQILFENKPGAIELFGQDQLLVLVLKEKEMTDKKPIFSSVLPIQSVDFSWQDPGTGERKSPEGFTGRVEYVSPRGIPTVSIESPAFLTLNQLDHFEITSISIDPITHTLMVNLKGKVGYVKTGTTDTPQDLRPTFFDQIRYSPLFEPVRKLIGS
jgi:Trypsin-like peptidase domain